jgi:senataxin
MVLVLECRRLQTDRSTLEAGAALHGRIASCSQDIWSAIARALAAHTTAVAHTALAGLEGHAELEKFKSGPGEVPSADKELFNAAYDQYLRNICTIFERLSDYDPAELGACFQTPETAGVLIAGLFSANSSLYSGAVEVIKVASSQSGRREALAFILKSHLEVVLNCVSNTVAGIAARKVFAPNPRMLKTCGDIFDILCNSQDGIFRTRALTKAEAEAVQNLWQSQWRAMGTIFEKTEAWSSSVPRPHMKEFARDTMQFADKCFDKYSVLANAIDPRRLRDGDQSANQARSTTIGKELLEQASSTLEYMVKWLRLRDEYLAETLSRLVCKFLQRLGEIGLNIGAAALSYVENVSILGTVRTVLSPQQKAELSRALEEYHGVPEVIAAPITSKDRANSLKQSKLSSWTKPAEAGQFAGQQQSPIPAPTRIPETIDLTKGPSGTKTLSVVRTGSVPAKSSSFGKISDEIRSASPALDRFRAKALPGLAFSDAVPRTSQASALLAAQQKAFREKRERERREKVERDQEMLARSKKGLEKFGGNEAPQPLAAAASRSSDMMVSSESEDDGDDELDHDFFGPAKPAAESESYRLYRESKEQPRKAPLRGPVKKIKQLRNAKDMRARLAPDLTLLHRTILSWDFFHDGEFPPNSASANYSLISNTFRTPGEYQATFQPLLVLEAWQSFVKSREEANWKPFEIKVASRATVDNFIEVGTAMPMSVGKDLGLGEADIILLSKGESPAQDADKPHCLARIVKILRKKASMEVTYRVNTNNPLLSSLNINAILHAVKVNSITPLEREYGALLGLQYYDLCDEIIKAKPSPLMKYSDQQLQPISRNYNLNIAQSKAVRSAFDNDAFTLIQG